MGRLILFLFLFVLVVPLIRMVLGLLARAFTDFAGLGPKTGAVPGGSPGQGRVPAGGILHKDPVCGTFVSDAVAKKLTAGGKTLHFCSDECVKKYQQQSR